MITTTQKTRLLELAAEDNRYSEALTALEAVRVPDILAAMLPHAIIAPTAHDLALLATRIPTDIDHRTAHQAILAWQRLSRQDNAAEIVGMLAPGHDAARAAADALREKQTAAATEAGLDSWVENAAWKALDSIAGAWGLELHHIRQLEHGPAAALAFVERMEAATPTGADDAARADGVIARRAARDFARG